MSVGEVADLLRVHDQTIWRWLKSGKLPGTKVGHSWRIDPDDVRKLLPHQNEED